MSGTNLLPGTFPKTGGLVAVMFPHNGSQGPRLTDRTDGFFAADPLVTSPTQVETWEITGFSVQVRLAAGISTLATVTYWARFGDIWAGVLKDFPLPGHTPILPIWPPARFPPDLSTFIKIWDGAEDRIAVTNANSSAPENYSQISVSTVLPFPITVQPGSQLAFAVVMTPSILDAEISVFVSDITYAINYNTISHRSNT